MKVNVAVAILFWEKLEQTKESISSFLGSGANIHILNNGSSEKSRADLGDFCRVYKQVKIHDSDRNLGVGPGRNYLIANTSEDWLLFVDNDITVVTPDWHKRFCAHVENNQSTEIFIPRLYNVQANRYADYKSLRILKNIVKHDVDIIDDETNCFPGGASFVKRSLFQRLGYYDNNMFIGLEDFELCVRAIFMGQPVRARIVHDIELAHDHRRARTEIDNHAVIKRYKPGITKVSFDHFRTKYNLIFDNNWKDWSKKELRNTARKYSGAYLKLVMEHVLKRGYKKVKNLVIN